jgi:hypothetical protein
MPSYENRRPISAKEVAEWMGHSKALLKQERYAVIAESLNRMSWLSTSTREQEPEPSNASADKFWDFKVANSAVGTLRECIPAMLTFWRGLERFPETREGYGVIERLSKALEEAAPLIQYPFGPREPGQHTKFPDFREWHAPAVAITKCVRTELHRAGDTNPSVENNSITVHMVHKSLKRMGFAMTVGPSAVSQYLKKVKDVLVLINATE